MDRKTMTVLFADDSESDVLAMKRAWKKLKIPHCLRVVADGEQCLNYLHRRGAYASPDSSPSPDLLLLDIRMPKVDGLEVLRRIRRAEKYRTLPVIVLTTSTLEEDQLKSYELGANAFIIKPVGFQNFSKIIKSISDFWQSVERPRH